jgi:hypothetical protein
VPGSGLDWAGARVHIGIRFSSVRSENRSSAAAMNVADFFTSLVFTALALVAALLTETGAVAEAAAPLGATAGVVVPLAVGVSYPGTWRSLPWVSKSALGKEAKRSSRAARSCFLARV